MTTRHLPQRALRGQQAPQVQLAVQQGRQGMLAMQAQPVLVDRMAVRQARAMRVPGGQTEEQRGQEPREELQAEQAEVQAQEPPQALGEQPEREPPREWAVRQVRPERER